MDRSHKTVRADAGPVLRVVLILATCACGCVSTASTERSGGALAPLEPHSRAAVPDASMGPGQSVANGRFEDRHWSHLNAVSAASVDEMCARITLPDNVVNQGQVDSYDVRRIDGELGYILVNRINRRIIEFEFEVTWRIHIARDGSACEARWDLTLAPSFIRVNRGWLRVSPLDEGLSLVEMQHELGAPQVGDRQLQRYLESVLERLSRDSEGDD